jgi:hypothetical protein
MPEYSGKNALKGTRFDDGLTLGVMGARLSLNWGD